MKSTDMYVIENLNFPGQYLLRTADGEPLFVSLHDAPRLFRNMKSVQNQVTRIKGDYNVAYRRVRLEVDG